MDQNLFRIVMIIISL